VQILLYCVIRERGSLLSSQCYRRPIMHFACESTSIFKQLMVRKLESDKDEPDVSIIDVVTAN